MSKLYEETRDKQIVIDALETANIEMEMKWSTEDIQKHSSVIMAKIDAYNPLQIDGILELLEHNLGKPEDFEHLEFSDEIVSIEVVGDIDTVDLEVTGDHLFYANDILTHNSAYGNIDAGLESVADSLGIIQTADTAVLFIQNDQMKEMNQMIWKFAKNRNTGALDSVMVKADFPKMRFSDWDGDEEISNDSNAVMAQGINKIATAMPDLGMNNPTGMIAQLDVGKLNFD